MKAICLIIGFSFVIGISIMNVCLLYDGTGPGMLMSEIISALSCILILGFLFIQSGIIWIFFSKLMALFTMITPLLLDEYRRFIPFETSRFFLPMNLLLVPICAISIAAIHKRRMSVKKQTSF